eukprot:g2802.t1
MGRTTILSLMFVFIIAARGRLSITHPGETDRSEHHETLRLAHLNILRATGAGEDPNTHPFAGSNCTCDSFCKYECAINGTTEKKITKTLYRMTPPDVLDLTDHNTGDASGDTSFVLERRTQVEMCRKDPNNSFCKGIVIQNNTNDVVVADLVEMDGQWGPYLYCNPLNTSNPEGSWKCAQDLNVTNAPSDFPGGECSATYKGYADFCFVADDAEHAAKLVENATSLSECCAKASEANVAEWTFYRENASCYVFPNPTSKSVSHKGCVMALLSKYVPKPELCDCERTQRAVGRKSLQRDYRGGKSFFPAWGEWYSTTSQGECTGDARVGDGSGCTWRVLNTSSRVNATCVYEHIDEAVEAMNASCFGRCNQPLNRSSSCYLGCYTSTAIAASSEALTAPWHEAVDGGVCGQNKYASTFRCPAPYDVIVDTKIRTFASGDPSDERAWARYVRKITSSDCLKRDVGVLLAFAGHGKSEQATLDAFEKDGRLSVRREGHMMVVSAAASAKEYGEREMRRTITAAGAALLIVGISVFYETYRSLQVTRHALKAYKDLLLSPHPADARRDPHELLSCPICGAESVDFPGDFCATHHKEMTDAASMYSSDDSIERLEESDMQSVCNRAETVVIQRDDFRKDATDASRRAVSALRDCGFVYLDGLYDPQTIESWKRAYDAFEASDRSTHWRYPCQGAGRRELMLPFESPFNDTDIYGNRHLRAVLAHAFKGTYKMELQTVITSQTGSGNQRWHQGWRYLFDSEEGKQPLPYAIIVGVVLGNLTAEQGPTEFCAGYNRRFYDGLRCPEKPVAAAMTVGGAYLFDYSVLHRGPGNHDPFGRERPVLMLAFSRNWFFNGGALVNRGRPLIQTSTKQEDVYGTVAKPIVEAATEGFSGTVFAYGQTGSGKTHTMTGQDADAQRGIIPRAMHDLFHIIRQSSSETCTYSVRLSYVQIYCEMIQDLLDPANTRTISVRESDEGGVYLDGVSRMDVSDAKTCLDAIRRGDKHRTTALTAMNATSSRSHAAVTLVVSRSETDGEKRTLSRARLLFVDLAGSERVKRSLEPGAVYGKRFEELRAINLSLSALGNCIAALSASKDEGERHVPFRDSKLTRLLQGSLGGSSKTALVLTVSPCPEDAGETASTLQFGTRAMDAPVRAVRHREVDYRALYVRLRKSVDGREEIVTKLEMELGQVSAEASRRSVEAERLKEALKLSEIQRASAEKRLKQLVRALTKMSRGGAAEGNQDDDDESTSPTFPLTALGGDADEDVIRAIEELSQKWHGESTRLREQIATQAEASRRKASELAQQQARRVEALASERAELELKLRQERETQLRTLKDFHSFRKRTLEESRDRDRRVADLIAELDEERGKVARLREERSGDRASSKRENVENDDSEATADVEARARAMLEDTVSRDYVSRPAVAEMEKLYNEILSKLQSRVEVLEAGGRKSKGAPAARRTKRTAWGATSSSTTSTSARRRTTRSSVRPTAMRASAVRSTGTTRTRVSRAARGASHVSAVRARRRAAAASSKRKAAAAASSKRRGGSGLGLGIGVYGLKSRFRM